MLLRKNIPVSLELCISSTLCYVLDDCSDFSIMASIPRYEISQGAKKLFCFCWIILRLKLSQIYSLRRYSSGFSHQAQLPEFNQSILVLSQFFRSNNEVSNFSMSWHLTKQEKLTYLKSIFCKEWHWQGQLGNKSAMIRSIIFGSTLELLDRIISCLTPRKKKK